MIQCDECDHAQAIIRVSSSRRDEWRTDANVAMAMTRLPTMCWALFDGRGRDSDDFVGIPSFSFAPLSLRRFLALSALLLSLGRCSDSSSMLHFSVLSWPCQWRIRLSDRVAKNKVRRMISRSEDTRLRCRTLSLPCVEQNAAMDTDGIHSAMLSTINVVQRHPISPTLIGDGRLLIELSTLSSQEKNSSGTRQRWLFGPARDEMFDDIDALNERVTR